MTVINDLIRRARFKPAELTINDNQVMTIAEHFRLSSYRGPLTAAEIADMIRAGKMHFLDIPVRVIGQNVSKHAIL